MNQSVDGEKTLHAGILQNLFSKAVSTKIRYTYVDLQQFSIGCLMDRISIRSVIRSLMIDKSAQLSADEAIPYCCRLYGVKLEGYQPNTKILLLSK